MRYIMDDQTIAIRKLAQQYAYTSLQMHEAIARKAGFSGTDHKYLGFFLQKGRLTAGELADLTDLTTGAVTGLIDRFEKKGLVKRQLDKNDRRKVFIMPNSKKIEILLKPLYQEFQDKTDELIASFSSRELKVIETYLSKAITLMIETKNKNVDI
jgi:DNA-binding MarR family transcriptional regulator